MSIHAAHMWKMTKAVWCSILEWLWLDPRAWTFFCVCILISFSLVFSLTDRTSSRFTCGSIQEKSLTCVRSVELPLLTTTTWRTTCACTPACAPISARAALRLLCARITCTATWRRTAATASPPVGAESLGCESQGSSMPRSACWALGPTWAPGLETSRDGGARNRPRQQRWMELLEITCTVLRCRSWQQRWEPETTGWQGHCWTPQLTLHCLWDRPVKRGEEQSKANFFKNIKQLTNPL